MLVSRPKEITSTAELREKIGGSFQENGFEMFVEGKPSSKVSKRRKSGFSQNRVSASYPGGCLAWIRNHDEVIQSLFTYLPRDAS